MDPAHILQLLTWFCAWSVAMRSAPTPPAQTRRLPTVSFSLSADLAERVRHRAWANGVSVSRVLREAVELALATWGCAEPAHEPDAEPAERRHLLWSRELRCRAARRDLTPVE